MVNDVKRRPYRFNFTLRTLFIFVTLGALAIWALPAYQTAQRRRAIDRIVAAGGTVTFESIVPPLQPVDPIGRLRRALGDRAVISVNVTVKADATIERGISAGEEAGFRKLFPETTNWYVTTARRVPN
jgi:hypothetical protein